MCLLGLVNGLLLGLHHGNPLIRRVFNGVFDKRRDLNGMGVSSLEIWLLLNHLGVWRGGNVLGLVELLFEFIELRLPLVLDEVLELEVVLLGELDIFDLFFREFVLVFAE